MKFLKWLGVTLGCLLILFGIYYGAYRWYLYKYGNEEREKYAKQYPAKTVEVNTYEEQKITQNTKFLLQTFDRKKNHISEEAKAMPVEYIGLTRGELTDYLNAYAKEPSLEDIEAGFEKYQIMSFSSSQLVLRKILAPKEVQYKYYLIEENGCVTVYYADLKTVYEYTNIIVDTLPEDVKEEIVKGKYVTTEEVLYDFLEAYTS